MRLFSYLLDDGVSIGVLPFAEALMFSDIRQYLPEAPRDMTAFLASADGLEQLRNCMTQQRALETTTTKSAKFLPVVPRPGKIVCMGLNYAAHAKEGGNAIPDYPAIFLRTESSQVGHRAPLICPRVSDQFDFEAELAVVIGREGRHLSEATALDHVAGYSVYNDGSVRNYQRKSSQWTMGKNFDGTGAFGPWLVTPDELPPGAAGLSVRSVLNGQTMQDGNTSDFIWNVAQTLALVSECMTLYPGDVVITGTPAGVGYARKPPVFMRAGDVCEIIIEGIGTLSNPVVAET